MIRFTLMAFSVMLLAISSSFASAQNADPQAHSCPDYFSVYYAPELEKPSKKSFRYFSSKMLSWFHQPYHMVHDEMIKEGTTATVIGKFDYGTVMHKDLEREYVKAYIFGTGQTNWEYLGRFKTNTDGKIFVPVANKQEGDYTIKMVVEGDLSVATGYLTVMKPGRKAVLFDIDGTLTLNDFQAVGDYLGVEAAATHAYATDTVWAYVNKGYQVVYITGRQYWMTKMTRNWFNSKGLFGWHLRTDSNAENPLKPKTQAYKRAYIEHLTNDLGLDIIRAYGNADTDVYAYGEAGLDKNETYIIGEHAGLEGTQAIDGDYSYHLTTVVENTPYAGCNW